MRHFSFFITLLSTDRGFSPTELIPCVVGATKQASHSSPVLWEPDPPHLPHKHQLSMSCTAAGKMLEIHSAAGNQGGLAVPCYHWKADLLEAGVSAALHLGNPLCPCRVGIKPPPPCSESTLGLCTGRIIMQNRKRESSPENCCWNCHFTGDLTNAKNTFWRKPRPLTVQKTRKRESFLCELLKL